MLLRSSRAAEALTKQSSIAGTVLKKTWKPLLGAGLVAGVAGPSIASSFKRGQMGTNKRYIQAQQAGVAPRLRPGTPTASSFAGARTARMHY